MSVTRPRGGDHPGACITVTDTILTMPFPAEFLLGRGAPGVAQGA